MQKYPSIMIQLNLNGLAEFAMAKFRNLIEQRTEQEEIAKIESYSAFCAYYNLG